MDDALAQLKGFTSKFTLTQLATFAVTFVLVVGMVVGSAMWLNTGDYALLFDDMDAESAAQVITRLKSMKVPYQVDAGGRAIRVRSESVDELRLELSSQGMPASGRIGFEIFDRTAFGATEFLEKVNYRRALEGEIARTIATITEVASARVHIAMGKDSLFGESRPAKASVVLKLRGQRSPAASTITGISNLVAASVEGLRPEAVVILDSFGRPLARPSDDDGDPLGAAQLERQQRLERDLGTRVVALLEPVIGAERVRVNVALKLNPQTTEETEERFDPNTVIRSRATSTDQANTPGALGQVAGVRSNTPPLPSDPKIPAVPLVGSGSSRTSETTNFEVSKTTKHVVRPPGEIARLSVAVILDDDQVQKKEKDGTSKIVRVARNRDELVKIQGLVAAAVGLDMQRGDQITVENVSFDEPLIEEDTPPSVFVRYAPQITEFGRLGTVLIIGLVGFLFVVRPLLKAGGVSLKPKVSEALQPVIEVQRPRTVADMQSEIEAQIDAQTVEKAANNLKLPALTKRVSAIIQKEPEQVAKLLQGWIRDPENS
ncbi:MAG TPA: flagellar basal-body MS-ring/collar protein FliF [Vicinamibacterales bacterium]|nr:flagellar basal-body MS-ring/collar protein FliF [Vicinamibacterales bacterium]